MLPQHFSLAICWPISDTASMPTLLSETERDLALVSLSRWTLEGSTIERTDRFPSFPLAIEFVRAVAHLAEAANHHPDIDIRWRNVTLRLSTHSAGGLTQKDIDLAHAIDALALP